MYKRVKKREPLWAASRFICMYERCFAAGFAAKGVKTERFRRYKTGEWGRPVWAAATLFVAISNAQAEVTVEPQFLDVSKHEHGIRVSNPGGESLQLEFQVREVFKPNTSQEHESPVLTPSTVGLALSAERMELKPGDVRRVRFENVSEPEQDRIFKVKILSQFSSSNMNENVDGENRVENAFWVFLRPKNARPEVEASREGRTLILENIGTTAAELSEGRFCYDDGGCVLIDLPRIFVGNREEVRLPSSKGHLKFVVLPGGKHLNM